MIFLACILGIGAGLLTGGRWSSIWQKRFRLLPLLYLAVACSLLLASALVQRWLAAWSFALNMRLLVLVVQYTAVTVFLAANRKKPGTLLVLSGGLLNALVMLVNQGQMPVGRAIEAFGQEALLKIDQAPHYFLASGNEPLLFLGDIIPVWFYMISVGDLLIFLGLFVLGWYLTRRLLRSNVRR